MKKFFLFLLLLPVFFFSQTTIAKWYNSDFTSTALDSKIETSKLKRYGGGITDESWGTSDVFYSTNSWPKPNYNNPSSSAFSENNYLQFSVNPVSGYKISPSRFYFRGRMQGGTAKMQIRYSKNADFSNSAVLQGETAVLSSYMDFDYSFPSSLVVNSGETLLIRIYIYETENNFHIEHNVSGSKAPAIDGKVLLMTPVAPFAKDDKVVTPKNTALNVDVLLNDDYRYSGALTGLSITGTPLNGTATVNAQQSVTYTPKADFSGYDRFYYTITNAIGVSNTAKVEVQVADGTAKVLTRWQSSNYSATNYKEGAFGLSMTKSEKAGLTINNDEGFELSNLPTPQQFDGGPDPQNYIQLGITIGKSEDYVGTLQSFDFKYRSQGSDGNITVKYSRNADFSGEVYTLLNGAPVSQNFTNTSVLFNQAASLYPGETVYIRIYGHNTYNHFFIYYLATSSAGPAITGTVGVYAPEPCSKTAVWNGKNWSIPPTINTKVVIDGDYDTGISGSLDACSIIQNKGKIIVRKGTTLTIANDLKVDPAATIEVESDANLIQINNDASANTGNITVLRDIHLSTARAEYNYLGTPVAFAAGENFKTIYPGITYALYHNETNNYFYNSSGANIPGRGLAVKEPTLAAVPATNELVTAKFKGVSQNGNISLALANSNTATNNQLGYNLAGNPYASNIDLVKLYALNNGKNNGVNASPVISATFYLWDNQANNTYVQQGSSYQGQAYAIFNAAAGTRGTGNSAVGAYRNSAVAKKIPTSILPVGQGFMVKSLAKNTTLQFNNTVRTSQTAEFSFLGKGAKEAEDDRFWLTLTTPSQLKSSMAVVYFEGGSQDLGVEDSENKGGSDALFSIAGDAQLVIDGRSTFVVKDQVKLGTRHFVAGTYTIGIEKQEGVFANGQSIYLKDLQTGIITDLTQGSYSFTANSGEATGRFEIVYEQDAVLGTGEVKEEITLYRDQNDFVVRAASKKINALEVYDANGRLIYQMNPQSKTAVIDSSRLAKGIYLVRVKQEDQISVRKILK